MLMRSLTTTHPYERYESIDLSPGEDASTSQRSVSSPQNPFTSSQDAILPPPNPFASQHSFALSETETITEARQSATPTLPRKGDTPQHFTQERRWTPGSLRTVPWTGLSALLVALLTSIAIIIVLFSANGKATDEWPSRNKPVQLSVALAVLIALANTSLALAHFEGVTISWWVKMLRGGDLQDSHRYWQHGNSAWRSLIQPHHFNKISLASILMVVLLVDGPLLQRGANITPALMNSTELFAVPLSKDLFDQPTAFYMTKDVNVNTLSLAFAKVAQNFTRRSPIEMDMAGCNGMCTATVIGAGFDVMCKNTTIAYELRTQATIGSIDVEWNRDNDPWQIKVATLHKPTGAQKGDLIRQDCTLQVAQVKYPIRTANGTTVLQPVNFTVNQTVDLYKPFKEAPGEDGRPAGSKLGGILMVIRDMYQSEVKLQQGGDKIYSIQGSGPMRYTYITSDDEALGTDRMVWEDPMPYVLESIRELMFRAAVAFSNVTGADQPQAQGTQTTVVNQYVLRREVLGGAMTIIGVCAIAVAFLFYGFWLLGRAVSMSPLETAKAFQAPIMADADSNAKIGLLLKQIGGRGARYGALGGDGGRAGVDEDGSASGQVLGIASPAVISWPLRGRSYSSWPTSQPKSAFS